MQGFMYVQNSMIYALYSLRTCSRVEQREVNPVWTMPESSTQQSLTHSLSAFDGAVEQEIKILQFDRIFGGDGVGSIGDEIIFLIVQDLREEEFLEIRGSPRKLRGGYGSRFGCWIPR